MLFRVLGKLLLVLSLWQLSRDFCDVRADSAFPCFPPIPARFSRIAAERPCLRCTAPLMGISQKIVFCNFASTFNSREGRERAYGDGLRSRSFVRAFGNCFGMQVLIYEQE